MVIKGLLRISFDFREDKVIHNDSTFVNDAFLEGIHSYDLDLDSTRIQVDMHWATLRCHSDLF